jgi:hypothetical protein
VKLHAPIESGFTSTWIINKILKMTSRDLFYLLKPLIPRSVQLVYRTTRVNLSRKKFAKIWPIDPASCRPPLQWNGWPGGRRFALVLTHDVETQRGQDKVKRLADVDGECGFRSSFNFVPERYPVSSELRKSLQDGGFEVGVHDLNHDGLLYLSRTVFMERAERINDYLREWGARGFRSAAMLHNLQWIGMLDIDYDASTFDTDPFEPQSDAAKTIFPFCVKREKGKPFVELPYTLAQDFTLFILMRERTIDVWTTKLDWIAEHGGMALINIHPDYIAFGNAKPKREEYPVSNYRLFLDYCRNKYCGEYWNALPSEVADYCLENAGDYSQAPL